MPASMFMSAPAQNPLPAPVMTMPTTSGSRSARPTASRTSAPIRLVHAFSASGRLRVMVATGSSTSKRICSYMGRIMAPRSPSLGVMRVHVDDERCEGHGRCYATAPEVFDADDLGNGHEHGDGTVLPELEKKARLA